MSTLTSNANSNNNNLIIASPPAAAANSSSFNSNNNNCNAINNNNNPATPTTVQNQHLQSALASGVSSAKRLLPFARSMSASSNGGGGATAGTGSTGGIPAELNVVLHGYHRKLKTNKKKYFVVYDDLPNKSARLEYFDSEKKFKQSWVKNSTVHAKRTIILRNCFNINKGHDPKKHVIALYTRDDCFSIVFDSEDELNRWLRTLWSLQRGEEGAEGEPPRPTFEHVWDVFVQRKGLGDSYGILGNYRLCITDKTLSLVRIGPPTTVNGDSRVEQVEFSLAAIRRCGASQRYFYLEVGRSTKTGAGEIWMEAQDAMIAHNMHTTIMKSAKNKDCDSLGPMRNRSSSANAASKPTQMLVRRQTHTGQKPINCSPSGGAAIARERCDSLPSRNRTSSETSTVAAGTSAQQQQLHLNSGGMPPPRTIPSASAFHQRPHSMVMVQSRQSHSHSPPVHSSPLSPPSTGACSTGSDGSSLSIDETDSFVDPLTPDEGNGFPKVINARSIPEENSDEFINNYGQFNHRNFGQHRSIEEFGSHLRHSYNSLSLPISQAVRRGSPAPPGGHHQIHHNLQHHLHQQQQQQHPPQMSGSVEGNYMDMCSPCGSSPGDPSGNGGYIPMSPVADYPRGLYTGSSSAHSRASSLAEDVPDGYVPMAPGGGAGTTSSVAPEESYVDMEPAASRGSSCNNSTHVPTPGIPTPAASGNGNISSAASSCSITSGTPSTDMRFSAYHLEKVEARFTPSEDDEMDRPLRTYSVGSRLEHNKRKLRVDMLSSAAESGGAGNSRVRAFSVGSRAKVPRSELYKGSGGAPITAPLLSAGSSGSMQESASNSGSITNTSTIGGMVGSGSSSSVGKVAGTTTGTTASGKKSISAPVLASSKPHGSFDPMDDLMEIDFGASYQGSEVESSTPQKSLGMEDYMEMGAVGGGSATSAIETGYMEMKPGHLPPAPLEESDYLDMKPGCYEPNLSTKSTSSPITINSPKKFNGGSGGGSSNNNNYLEMSPRGAGPSSLSSSSTQRKVPSDDYLNIIPVMVGGGGAGTGGDSGNEDKMTHDEDELLVAPSSAPEGYMEMSWNQKKSSLGAKVVEPAVSDEYINMDFTRKELPESRLTSQPIAIQPGGSRVVGDLIEPKMGGAPSNIPNYLPLNPAQQRHGIGFSPRSRCDSRDSGIVTPSGSQATIFPFSPGSPIKPFVQADPTTEDHRKCLIDGTSGTLLITELDEHSEESNESRVEDLSHNYAELSLQQPHLKTEKSRPSSFKRTCTLTTTCTSTRTSASVVTTVKSAVVEYPDYVNCSPATTPVTPKPTSASTALSDDQAGDYAIMNPASLRKLSSTSQSELATPCSSGTSSISDAGLPPLLGKKSSTIGFRPITSSQDDALLRKTASGISPKPTFTRQFSERRPTGTDASGYELLQRSASSRPNSVNSEKIGCGGGSTSAKCPSSSTRPNSANSDRLPVVISATSSSASSTSTLCESKNQSPMASTTTLSDPTQPIVSRPPSVSSERELHYASLDLPPCGTNPPPAATRMDVDPSADATPPPPSSDSLNSSPSPNSGCTSQQPGAFTYAQIDFDRTGAPIPPKAGGQP